MKKIIVLVFMLLGCYAMAQRLPANVVPDHYSLVFTPDLNTEHFEGDETIDVRFLSPSDTVTLNAQEMEFHKVTVEWAGNTTEAAPALQPESETLTLRLPSAAPAGPAKIHILYTGTLNKELRGLYVSHANGRKYVVSQFESVDARAAFPSFDEPAYKATFDISTVIDARDTAISNGTILSDTEGPVSGKHTVRFSTTPRMSTYLVALAVGDWKCISGEQDGIPLRVCSVPGKEQNAAFALEATKAVLKFYDQYFGIKYPYGKLDQLAVADFDAGAMENTAAIIYRERDLLLDEKYASVEDRNRVATVIAHEMAHQWFGDLVTMKWWDDIWLNEGFASWMESKPVAAWKPEWAVPQDEVESSNRSLDTDANENTRPIRHPAETREEIESLFDRIAYEKTASVLRMLESYMGPGPFAAGVNRYLKEHAYSNATAEDFWTAMASSSAGQPIDKLIISFVTQPGVPYIRMAAHCKNGVTSGTLTQQRFYDSAERMQQPGEQLWQIPVCMRVSGTRSSVKCVLLSQKQQQFSVPSCGQIFLNASGAGYYRYGVEPEKLRSVDKLSATEQVSLASDASALLRAGQLSIGDYLTMADRLAGSSANRVFAQLKDDLRFVGKDLVTGDDRGAFQNWVRGRFSPAMERLGYRSEPADSPNLRVARAQVLEIAGNIGENDRAIAEAKRITAEFMKHPDSTDRTMAASAIKVAAAHSGEELYNAFLGRLKAADSAQEYYLYFYALADFRDPALLHRTLDWTLGPDVRSQDLRLIRSIMENPAGETIAWNWVQQHAGDIQQKAGSTVWGLRFLYDAIGGFCSTTAQQQAQTFFEQTSKHGLGRVQRAQLANIGNCAALREREQSNLAMWLKHADSAPGQK